MLRRFAGVKLSECEAGSPQPKSRAFCARDLVLKRFADVAQLVEHSLGKGEVTSSILVIGSRWVG